MGVVSHRGDTTHSGHYVTDLYSAERDHWIHYDDNRVSYVNEAEVFEGDRQKNGYILFYMHSDLCSHVMSAEAVCCTPANSSMPTEGSPGRLQRREVWSPPTP